MCVRVGACVHVCVSECELVHMNVNALIESSTSITCHLSSYNKIPFYNNQAHISAFIRHKVLISKISKAIQCHQ